MSPQGTHKTPPLGPSSSRRWGKRESSLWKKVVNFLIGLERVYVIIGSDKRGTIHAMHNPRSNSVGLPGPENEVIGYYTKGLKISDHVTLTWLVMA
uniref:Uncharacterized protein n=1 Tax=Moniliophthora roreri TaxID=221103 RepID=A0A0W0GEE0_MONRR